MQNTQTAIDYSVMEAGNELDSLIAEKVMGWQWYTWKIASCSGEIVRGLFPSDYENPFHYEKHQTLTGETRKLRASGLAAHIPDYSKNIAAAFQVVSRFTDSKIPFSIKYDVNSGYDKQTGWSIAIDGVSVVAFCDSLPLAICRAALDTLTWDFPPLAATK